jgi:hypothetical protein
MTTITVRWLLGVAVVVAAAALAGCEQQRPAA